MNVRKSTRAVIREEKSYRRVCRLEELLNKMQGSLKPRRGKRSMMDTLLAERRRKKLRF